jgi:hypothetical protein
MKAQGQFKRMPLKIYVTEKSFKKYTRKGK